MEIVGLNGFSILTLLAGGLLLITGLLYKLHPPKIMTWYAGIQLKTARRSRESFQEAVRFAARPITLAGLMLLIAGLLPVFFFKLNFFTLSLAAILIVSTCMVLISLINQHINSLFDEDGKRKIIV